MISTFGRQPAIALVDDDAFSARLMMRMLAAHAGPPVEHLADAAEALTSLAALAALPEHDGHFTMVVVDLKSSSHASRDFIVALKAVAPRLTVVAMAPSLDRDTRNALLDAGAAAVFERHAELAAYRRETANIVGFWVRSQRLSAIGT